MKHLNKVGLSKTNIDRGHFCNCAVHTIVFSHFAGLKISSQHPACICC